MNKMKNPIKKYKEWRTGLYDLEMNEKVNTNVYVANDPNDPENGIYVFVADIPVMRVIDCKNGNGNAIPIDKVGEFIANVKNMFRNSINKKPISNDVQRKETDN